MNRKLKIILILLMVLPSKLLEAQNVDFEFYARRYISSPELSRVLSYADVFRINAEEAKAMSYDLENIARLDVRSKDPNELLRAYDSKVQEINNYVQQKQADINRQLLTKAATVLGDKILLNQSADPMDLVVSGLSLLNQSSKADAEKEKALKAVEKEMQNTMDGIKTDVINNNQKTIHDLLGSAAESFSESDETYYLDFANFYICYNKSINSNYNYKNTSWISNTTCEKPVKPFNIPNLIQTKWDQCLISAKRKYELYKKYKDERFLTASIKYVNSAITSNNKFVEAYYFKSTIVTNSAEKYINVLIASNLDPKNKSYSIEKDVAFKVFKTDFFNAISENKDEYLLTAVQYDLQKSFAGISDENPVLFSINKDNPNALQIFLNKEVSANQSLTPRLQNLLSLCAIKNAYKCAERLIKLGTNPDQKESNGQTPLFLAARYGSVNAENLLLNSNVDFDYNLDYLKKNLSENEFREFSKNLMLDSFNKEKLGILSKILIAAPGIYKEKINANETFLVYMVKNNKSVEELTVILPYVENNLKNENQLLLLALKSGNTLSARALLFDRMIDINIADATGNTALHYALTNDLEDIALKILERNPKINVANSNGIYPIKIAIDKNQSRAIKKMVSMGCDFNVYKYYYNEYEAYNKQYKKLHTPGKVLFFGGAAVAFSGFGCMIYTAVGMFGDDDLNFGGILVGGGMAAVGITSLILGANKLGKAYPVRKKADESLNKAKMYSSVAPFYSPRSNAVGLTLSYRF